MQEMPSGIRPPVGAFVGLLLALLGFALYSFERASMALPTPEDSALLASIAEVYLLSMAVGVALVAVSLATLIGYYQPAFILLSLPALVAAPYLTSSSLSKVFREGCVFLERKRVGSLSL